MKKRILIVDDEEDIIRVLATQLRERRFDVQAAIEGQEALTLIRKDPPDLIILDIMLPNMDGTQIAAQLKQNKETAAIPIIFLSALQTKEGEMGGEGFDEEGKNIILAKPYDIDVLVAKIHELII
ncbi:MAG: response regulator [Candidatus Omnitrophica bacterium]|nr:response regulator [Candidatus Omnitrophota bacterium]